MTRSADPYDELAAMFLTAEESTADAEDADGEDDVDGSSVRTSTIELLVVGHLPVRASLWLAPYADAVARDAGTTALVRLDGEEPMLQLLTPRDATPNPTSCRNLRETILQIGPAVRHWIVRPSSRSTPEDIGQSGARCVTILSSADQAALVNAYRCVKEIVDALPEDDSGGTEIGLAVIGSNETAAQLMADRLDQTTRECLSLSVPLVRCLPRMEAAFRASWLRSFPGQVRPALGDVLGWIEQASRLPEPDESPAPMIEIARPVRRPAAPPREIPASPPARLEEPVTAARDVVLESPFLTDPPPVADVPPAPPAPAPPIPAAPAPTPPALKLAPKAAAQLEPKQPQADREPVVAGGAPVPLADYVPGLRPIAPRCPGHERIELALDAAGRIHLLAREDMLRAFCVVEAWATAHRELLDLACPGEPIDARGRTVCHLFTDEPVKVADLHGSNLRLHLLVPVAVGDKRAWYAAPLNVQT